MPMTYQSALLAAQSIQNIYGLQNDIVANAQNISTLEVERRNAAAYQVRLDWQTKIESDPDRFPLLLGFFPNWKDDYDSLIGAPLAALQKIVSALADGLKADGVVDDAQPSQARTGNVVPAAQTTGDIVAAAVGDLEGNLAIPSVWNK